MASVIIYTILIYNFVFTSAIATVTNAISKNVHPTASNYNKSLYSDEFYIKAHSVITKSTFYHNWTVLDAHDWVDEVASWDAPKKLEESFPYYLAGYNDDNLPVWIFESGKYNVRGVVEKGEKAMEALDKYVRKGFINMLLSMYLNGTEDISEIVFILDYDCVDINQIRHLPTISFVNKLAGQYGLIAYAMMQKLIVINASFAVEVIININRPILGQLMEKVSVYGTNRSKWIPMLRREFSEEILPPWYGGRSSFKPISAFG